MKPYLTLVVPCYNEEVRLQSSFSKSYNALKRQINHFQIILVDDGSSDETLKVINFLSQKYPEVLGVSYPINHGKGYAVKRGVEKSDGKIIGYTDADFAISLEHIGESVELIEDGADIVIGDRSVKEAHVQNKPSLIRRFLGRILSKVNRIFLDLGEISDSQCGFKFFKKRVAKELFSDLKIDRWLFDVNILMLARRKKMVIKKVPVRWREERGSKVSLGGDIYQVVKELGWLYYQFSFVKLLSFLMGLLLFLILLIYFINPDNLVLRSGDYSDVVWPDYFFLKESLSKFGQIPLWNSTLFSGIPEISNPQSPIIYPLNYLVFIFPIGLTIVFLIWLHFLLSAIFMYLIGERILKLRKLSSVILAFSFSLSPFYWGKAAVGHLSQLFAILLLSPLLYFSMKYFKKNKLILILPISILLSLQYLNYPTIWYYVVFFGAIAILYLSILGRNIRLMIGFFVSLVLSLTWILPIFLAQIRTGPLITRSNLNIQDLAIPLWSIKRFLTSILFPSNLFFDNETEVWLYPGITVILLSIIGFLKITARFKPLIAIFLLLVLLITLGNRTPVFNLLSMYVPGFSYLRVATRDWFIFITTISFLAAWGFNNLRRFRKFVFIITLLDLILFSALRVWFVPEIMQPNKGEVFSSLLMSTDYRYYCTSRCLSASWTLPKNINTADGYHLLILRGYREEISSAGGFEPTNYTGNIPAYEVANSQPSAEKLGTFSVKYIISENSLQDKGFRKISTSGKYTLYENTKVLERFRFDDQKGSIEIDKDSPNELRFITDRNMEGRLIIGDAYHPDWEVYIDSKKSKISLYQGWARLITVPPGRHIVELKFSPFSQIFNYL